MTKRSGGTWRASMSLTAGLCALAALGACTEPTAPARVHDEVEWQGGIGPSGSDGDDPRIAAVRRYDVLFKASANELDLSDPRLAEVTTPEWIDVKVDRLRRDVEARSLTLWAGPDEMTVVAVVGDGDAATVYMCARRPTRWFWDSDASEVHEASRDDAEPFDYSTYELVRVDGRWLVDTAVSGRGPKDGPCDPGPDVALGTFATQPDLDVLGTLTPEDVVAPSS